MSQHSHRLLMLLALVACRRRWPIPAIGPQGRPPGTTKVIVRWHGSNSLQSDSNRVEGRDQLPPPQVDIPCSTGLPPYRFARNCPSSQTGPRSPGSDA
jgi:hypothetical protein